MTSTGGGTTTVQFACQQCKQPLKLEVSLLDLNVDSFRQLTGSPGDAATTPIQQQEQQQQQQQFQTGSDSGATAALRRIIHRFNAGDESVEPPVLRPSQMSDDGGASGTMMLLEGESISANAMSIRASEGTVSDGFVIVGSGTERQKRAHPYRIKVAAKLFDILSSSSHIDHPLCEECNTLLQRDVAAELREMEMERDHYRKFLDTESLINMDEAEQQRLETDIAKLQKDEQELLTELVQIENEREELIQQNKELDEQAAILDSQEDRYWRELNSFQLEQEKFQNDRDILRNKHALMEDQLRRLRQTYVLNDIFHIDADGHFGTINNLRLGRLSTVPVEWSEINAAWGQTALLLQTLAREKQFRFETYRLIPMGSFSKIEKLSDKSVYDLYGSSDFQRLLRFGRFDTAMVAFLDCLKQLCVHVQSKDKNFKYFPISGDKINDFSIKLQSNAELAWTKALKYTLITLKWLLSHNAAASGR